MRLPQNLEEKRFIEWNEVVKGLVESWDLANRYGLETYLEQRLAQDQDGSLTVMVSRLGNELRRLQTEQLYATITLPDAEARLRRMLSMALAPS